MASEDKRPRVTIRGLSSGSLKASENGDTAEGVDLSLSAKPETGCDVCSKILRAFRVPKSEDYCESLGTLGSILSSECSAHLEFVKKGIDNVSHDQTLYFSKSDGESSAKLFSYSDLSNVFGVSVLLGYRESHSDAHASARTVDPQWIDTSLVLKWKSDCISQHNGKCETTSANQESDAIRPIWLIDVVQECLVPGDREKLRYLALSYTWGGKNEMLNTKAARSGLLRPGTLASDTRIPRTIKDAMSIVRRLEERYLWIDSICIEDDDHEVKTKELSYMHTIYASAFITMVAADGTHADYGLRGLKGCSNPRFFKQTVFELGDAERLVVPNFKIDGGKDFRSSRIESSDGGYFNRAWTFQEYAFSKRRLIFEQNSVHWECQCAWWCEDIITTPGEDSPLVYHEHRWTGSHVPELGVVHDVARVYNQKSLTRPEDALFAFSGIQTMLNQTFSDGLLFGLPETLFDVALLWFGVGTMTRRIPSARNGSAPHGLPSWSWLGWKGDFWFPRDSEQASGFGWQGFLSSVAKWYTMKSPRSVHRRGIQPWWEVERQYAQDVTQPCPPGWTRHQYTGGGFQHNVKIMPRETPSHYFTHPRAKAEITWYPITGGQSSTNPIPQTQFLFCQTTRVFLYADADPYNGGQRTRIRGQQNVMVGYLNLHNREDLKSFGKPIELVAISKGWSTRVGSSSIEKAPEQYSTDRCLREYGRDLVNCVFVLWIEWVDGVAYRRGSGVVTEQIWEKEKELVDLILG